MSQQHQPGPISQSGAVVCPDSESGYLLLFVLFLAALMLIALAVAAPRIATSIQREKEIELVHRGDQYKRAIKLYYRKFGTYPTSIDQLINTNNIRFLRKRYTDPITGRDDWRIIHLGQAKVPPLGFFGQPLTGLPGATNAGTPVSATTGGAFANATPGTLPTNPFGSSTSDSTDTSDQGTSDSSEAVGQSASSNPSTTITGAPPGFTPPGSTSPTGTAGTTSPSSSPFGSNSGPGSNLGGGPIVGVGIPSPKASLLTYKKQKHYNQWEFVYNPIEDQMQAASAALNGGNIQSTNGANSSFGNSSSGAFGSSNSSFGNSNNSSPFGNDNSSGSPGATTPPPGSNQQQ